jgi:hypothetical protein
MNPIIHLSIILLILIAGAALLGTVSPIIKGITTIQWGSGSTMGSPAGAAVISGRITPKNGMPIEIEDVNGFTAALVFLDDGFDAEVLMMYDTSLTWPAVAATVALTLPKWGAAGGTQSFNTFVAAEPAIDIERKKEAIITYKLIYRPNCPAT